ncbi:hypothetical protein IGI04_015234, partial [Brassica rapa subsp. trilocularis]
WDVRLLEDYVSPANIPFIRSLAISSAHHRDTFCWSYTKNGQYTFSGYGWVWMDSLGKIQILGIRNYPWQEFALHSEMEALRWAMKTMLQHSTCQSFGTDCKDLIAMIKELHDWPSFAA